MTHKELASAVAERQRTQEAIDFLTATEKRVTDLDGLHRAGGVTGERHRRAALSHVEAVAGHKSLAGDIWRAEIEEARPQTLKETAALCRRCIGQLQARLEPAAA